MHLKPIPSGPGAFVGADSSIAFAISSFVRSIHGILCFLFGLVGGRVTVGSGEKSIVWSMFAFSPKVVAGFGFVCPWRVGVLVYLRGFVYWSAVNTSFPWASPRNFSQCLLFASLMC